MSKNNHQLHFQPIITTKKMKTYNSILEFQKHFTTEVKCREFLEEKRWKNTPACHFFESTNVCGFSNNTYISKCIEKVCRNKFSVAVGTIYKTTKSTLIKLLLATYILSVPSKGISSLNLVTWLYINQKTT